MGVGLKWGWGLLQTERAGQGGGGIHRMLVLLIQVVLSFNKSGRSEIVPIQ